MVRVGDCCTLSYPFMPSKGTATFLANEGSSARERKASFTMILITSQLVNSLSGTIILKAIDEREIEHRNITTVELMVHGT